MSSFKLLKLLLEREPTSKPKECGSNAAVKCDSSTYTTMRAKVGYHTWIEGVEGEITTNYYYCKTGKAEEKKPVEPKPVVAGECPSDEKYADAEFKEWAWVTISGYNKTDNYTTKLCGTKTDKVTALNCNYTKMIGMACGTGLKSVWKELREKFIDFKKNNSG